MKFNKLEQFIFDSNSIQQKRKIIKIKKKPRIPAVFKDVRHFHIMKICQPYLKPIAHKEFNIIFS